MYNSRGVTLSARPGEAAEQHDGPGEQRYIGDREAALERLREVCGERGYTLIVDYENLLDYPLYINPDIKLIIARENINHVVAWKISQLIE